MLQSCFVHFWHATIPGTQEQKIKDQHRTENTPRSFNSNLLRFILQYGTMVLTPLEAEQTTVIFQASRDATAALEAYEAGAARFLSDRVCCCRHCNITTGHDMECSR